jgi:hypothetical protein
VATVVYGRILSSFCYLTYFPSLFALAEALIKFKERGFDIMKAGPDTWFVIVNAWGNFEVYQHTYLELIHRRINQ